MADLEASFQTIQSWLIEGAPAEPRAVEGFIERLCDAGLDIDRAATGIFTLHPVNLALGVRWAKGTGLVTQFVPYEAVANGPGGTPIEDIAKGKVVERRERLEEAESSFHALRLLRADGFTDYFIHALRIPRKLWLIEKSYVSIATKRPGGFRDDELELVRRLIPTLALRLELIGSYTATDQLLDVYLGHNAARRVIDGAFVRGSGQLLDAAIWYCDLRGFTSLVDQNPIETVVPALDEYFDRVAAPVTAAGGEILKFIGDAMLAIFPIGKAGAADACHRALEAATKALEAVETLSREREARGVPQLRIGVALHRGTVMYGNIGASNRLDFTVIGAAVNEVCRVESLCKELKTPLLATEAFAEAAGREGLQSVGRHTLRGVAEKAELLTLKK